MEGKDIRPGMVEVFTRYIRKNGKIIRPKNAQFFHFWVDVKRDDPVKDAKTKASD